MPPPDRRVLVAEADVEVARPRAAVRSITTDDAGEPGDVQLESACLADVEERPRARQDQGFREGGRAEGHLVVAAVDARQELEVEGGGGQPLQLEPRFGEPLVAEELLEDGWNIDEGAVVLMENVQIPEVESHESRLHLGIEGERHELEPRLGEAHAERARARPLLELLTCLEDHHRPGVRIDLPEEAHFDLLREEPIRLTREGHEGDLGSAAVEREVPNEVSGHADVQEQLAGPAALVQRERFPRAGEVQGGDLGGRARSRRRRAGGDRCRSGRRASRR